MAALVLLSLLAGNSINANVVSTMSVPMHRVPKFAVPVLSPYDASFTNNKLSPDLRERLENQTSGRVTVIVQADDIDSAELKELIHSSGTIVVDRADSFDMLTLDVPAGFVKMIGENRHVHHISLDRETKFLGHVETTTGVSAMRATTGNSSIDGRGIGIAIVDTGIYAGHDEFTGANGSSRVVAQTQFELGGAEDKYGHGTHVAALAAGRGGRAGNFLSTNILDDYQGIAPGANIIAVRVLTDLGTGSSSKLIRALDWIYANRQTYNIRVVNLSLGSPAVESWRDDPVCRAARKLTDAGVVVVAAAGNDGKNLFGQKVYGTIHSPGIDPTVITVGATNTFGTDLRSDDGVATYSSRGPTRSYYTDENGDKVYDHLVKPDLVAPGNKLISAKSRISLLSLLNPTNEVWNDGLSTNTQLIYMSGSSMASPIVAGAAALMLQANPTLTPNMIKMILMYTAQPLARFNHLEQGAGAINIEGAVRLAKLVRTDLRSSTRLGAPMLTTATMPDQRSTIAGQTVRWSQGMMVNYGYAKGTALITKYQKVYGLGLLLSDGLMISDGLLISDGLMLSDGLLLSDNVLISNGLLISDGVPIYDYSNTFGSGLLLSDGLMISDGLLISDSFLLDLGILSPGGLSIGLPTLLNGDDSGRMR